MTDVAASGGMILQVMGTPAEVMAFFTTIHRHAGRLPEMNLVTDRLFRRTVPGDKLDDLEKRLEECWKSLEKVRVTDGFWDEFSLGDRSLVILRVAINAAAAFAPIFEALDTAIDYARHDQEFLGYIRPLRLLPADGPAYYEARFMPLEEFEKPDIRPVWLD